MSLFQIPKVIRNMSSDLCVSVRVGDVCQRNWITVHSVANFGAHSVDLQDKFVTLGSLILFGLLIGCYKRIAETKIQQVQPKTSSASDWTVKIKFDKQRPSEDKIRELIYRIAPNVKIQKINSCYKLDEFTEQFNKVSLLKKELRRLKVQEFSRLREEKNKLIAQERENRGSTNILGAEDNLEFSKMATEVTVLST